MGVLSGLQPQAVFRFFEELCAIPHGSHNTKAISDYLAAFAEARGLRYRQDELNNVIIWKGATSGYESAPAVMIQGHMDMVAEKDADCEKDMEKEGLDLFVEGDLDVETVADDQISVVNRGVNNVAGVFFDVDGKLGKVAVCAFFHCEADGAAVEVHLFGQIVEEFLGFFFGFTIF